MNRKIVILVTLITLFALLVTSCAPAAPQAATKKIKLAVVLPGVITDADYNSLAYIALTAAKEDMGIETAYSESVAVPDVERVMREYVDNGFNLIWTHGGQFITQTQKLAGEFKDVTFIGEGDAAVKDMPENMWMIDRNFHIGFYAIGVLAAKASKTGKIGYIAGQTLPFSYAEVHAMQQAIQDQNLKVDLKTVWSGDFNDPTKGRQVADAMIADGIDVLVCSLNLGAMGVFEAVKAQPGKALVIAKYIDKSKYAPDAYITALLYDFKGPLKEIITKVQNGEKGQYYPLGFQTGVALQTPLTNVSPEVGTDVTKIIDDIKAGKIEVKKDVEPIK